MNKLVIAAVVAAAALATATAGLAAAKSQARAKGAVCPSVSILPDAVRITQMSSGRVDLKAEIREPEIACTVAGGKAKSKLSFWVKSAIAPTANVAARTVPYFVAIIVDGEVIGKEVFDLALPFAGGDRKLMVKEKIARVDIPVAHGRTAEDYSVTIGFQLTPEQVNYNRTASR
jgi:hypothetical protein